MFRIFALFVLVIALAFVPAAPACDYGSAAITYGYSAPVQQFYAVPAIVAPYYAPALQLGYAAPVSYGVQAFAAPLAVSSYGVSSYGLGVSRVRVVSPFAVRVGGFRSRIVIR